MNLIEKYSFGKIIINKKRYTRDLIVFPNEIKANWWRKEGHKLCMEDLSILREKKPDTLIIGTGSLGVLKVPEEVVKELNEMNIEILSLKTPEAVEKYNELAQRGEKIAGAFHLTC